jgi:hypothetical protein
MKTQKEYPETHFRSSEAERIHNEGYELMLINNTLPFNNRPVLGDVKHGFVSMSWDAWHKNRDSMRLKRLTNPQLLNGEIKNDRIVSLYKGCKVHLMNKGGTYIVKSYDNEVAVITCQRWINQKEWGQRYRDTLTVPRSEIKCHYGGGKYSKL